MTGAIRWKKSVALILAVAALSGCALTPPQNQSPDQTLTVGNAVYDFEYAGPMQTIRQQFKFANTGHAAVSITGLSVCCGCDAQTTEDLNTPIGPGQLRSVIITCTLPRYEGPVEKVSTLHTDAMDNESIPLIIKGKVRRDIVLVPSALSFGKLKKGEGVRKRLRVLQMSNQPLTIRKVGADLDHYTIETTRFDEQNHRGYDIIVGFSANVAPGAYSDVITIHTNDQRRPKIDVPVVAHVIDR